MKGIQKFWQNDMTLVKYIKFCHTAAQSNNAGGNVNIAKALRCYLESTEALAIEEGIVVSEYFTYQWTFD